MEQLGNEEPGFMTDICFDMHLTEQSLQITNQYNQLTTSLCPHLESQDSPFQFILNFCIIMMTHMQLRDISGGSNSSQIANSICKLSSVLMLRVKTRMIFSWLHLITQETYI